MHPEQMTLVQAASHPDAEVRRLARQILCLVLDQTPKSKLPSISEYFELEVPMLVTKNPPV